MTSTLYLESSLLTTEKCFSMELMLVNTSMGRWWLSDLSSCFSSSVSTWGRTGSEQLFARQFSVAEWLKTTIGRLGNAKAWRMN